MVYYFVQPTASALAEEPLYDDDDAVDCVDDGFHDLLTVTAKALPSCDNFLQIVAKMMDYSFASSYDALNCWRSSNEKSSVAYQLNDELSDEKWRSAFEAFLPRALSRQT